MINLYFKDKCPYCSEFISERCDDYVIDTSYYDREMGTETEYTIECDEYTCPNCDQGIQHPLLVSMDTAHMWYKYQDICRQKTQTNKNKSF